MQRLLVGLLACAACAEEPPVPGPDPDLEVHITKTTSGLIGIPITFAVTDADGTVVLSGNSTGQPFRVPIHPGARLRVDEDGSSSPTSRFSNTFTLTDLQPGDRVVRRPFEVTALERVGEMTLRFVGAPDLPPDSSYYFVTPCQIAGGFASSAWLSFYSTCVPTGAFTIDGYVFDATGPRLHTVIAVPEFQAGGTIDATEVWSPVPTRSITVRGLPPDASTVRIEQQSHWLPSVVGTATPAAGEAVLSLPVIAAPGDVATLEVVTTRVGALGSQRHRFGVDDAAPAVTLDLAAHPLPWITGPLVYGAGGLTWTQDGAGTPDFVRVSESWSSWPSPPPIHGGSYEVLGPPGNSIAGGQTSGTLRLIDCPGADGYEQVKQDHWRACSTVGLGQVYVESVLER